MYGNKLEDILKKKWDIADLNQTINLQSVKEQRVNGSWIHYTFSVFKVYSNG